MKYTDYTDEQIREVAMLDIAHETLREQGSTLNYHDLLKKVAEVKGLTEEQTTKRIAHLYTEMSLDGRFVNLGNSNWGLRTWYPIDQTEEDMSHDAMKERKQRAKDKAEDEDVFEDDDLGDFDEFENLEDELDSLATEEDTDFDELDDETESFPDEVPEEDDEADSGEETEENAESDSQDPVNNEDDEL
ncbi:DNA-directed RNA polymerase subunit delta [Salisediminibacterium halotolerans]|uniref:Probable DNA-directed RNA polymerase subunit delta n=1 Tax=Salisediminibacterium halotolerans TaxID=517425 RepID=A0A1H9QTT8_9BACI|nr:DNA-directed RNA polymerase subunit delta [Salisediminibacterium haloalkalitolerans]SER63655.1 DNA-directed RNA polymerase subunit delta [Salisediminibacterium haloalkalitolerans]